MSTSAANSRARLSRVELHQLRWLLGLALVLLAFWTLFSLELGGITWRTGFFMVAASALAFPGWPGRIPVWVRRWAVIFGAAALFIQFVATRFDIISGLVLLVSLLTLARGLQYRRLREDWQLILLCLFIIILCGVLTLSLLFGLQILLFTLVAMALLFVMNLLERDTGRALSVEDWKHFHWVRFLRNVCRAINPRQLFLAAGLFTGLVLVSTLIFISIPRFQFAQAFNFVGQRGVAGFHSEIQYSVTRGLDKDDSTAFRVDVAPGVHLPPGPYWRMIVFDEYRDDGFRLSNSKRFEDYHLQTLVRYPDPLHSGQPSRNLDDVALPTNTLQFYLEGDVSEYLPVLGPFVSLTFSGTQNFLANELLRIYSTEQPSPKVLGYKIDNMALGDTVPAPRYETDRLSAPDAAGAPGKNNGKLVYPQTYFGLPQEDGDVAIIKGIVDEIRNGRTDMTESEFVKATIAYLQKHHTASLNVDLTGIHSRRGGQLAHDILVRWLDSNAPGWCEHFAGGLTLLCRAAGYPTRVVAGYKGAVYNTIDNYYSVKQSFAHAWVEVFDPAKGDRWLRVDPSPGGDNQIPGVDAIGQMSSGISTESGWSAFFDGLRMVWYRRVINFDQTDQVEMVNKVSNMGKDFGSSLKKRLREMGDKVKAWFTTPMTPRRAVALSTPFGVLGLAFLLRRRLHNFWLRVSAFFWRGKSPRLTPMRLDAGRWLRHFEPAWAAHASTLPAPERAEWAGVRLDLLALRYGPLDVSVDPEGVFHKAKSLLRKAKSAPSNRAS